MKQIESAFTEECSRTGCCMPHSFNHLRGSGNPLGVPFPVAGCCGALTPAKVVGIALNTSKMSEEDALAMIERLEAETGLPVTDVIRFGAEKLGKELL